MREYSFSSFLPDASNRRAYDLCLSVARGEPIAPLPLVLVAEGGCGKSHLLHAIAHRLRAASPHAAIVFARPDRFVEDLRRLLADPKPIDMARYAVLLIDDLHAFDEETETLGRLVDLFLENDHPVVITSEAHPDRMTDLPAGLRRRLRAGQTIVFEPGDAQKDLSVVEARVREETESAIARMHRRIEELESGGPEAAAKRSLVRRQEVEALRGALTEARHELEDLRGQNALLSADARAAKALRARVEELERAQVERAEQAAPDAVEADEALKRRLEEARFDAQRAREDARAMLERAEGLLEELHENREAFAQAQRESVSQREEILRFATTLQPALPSEGDDTPEAAGDRDMEPRREGPIGALQSAATAIAELESNAADAGEVSRLHDTVERLQESVVRAHAERDNLKSHLSRIREDLDEARRDLEKTREEATAEVGRRDERIRELEETLVARRTELDRLMRSQDTMHTELDAIQSDIGEDTRLLERVLGLLGISREELRASEGGVAGWDATEAEVSRDDAGDADAGVGIEAADDDRPDFGEGLRLVPRTGATIHHVEELRAAGGYLPPLDDEADDEGVDEASNTA